MNIRNINKISLNEGMSEKRMSDFELFFQTFYNGKNEKKKESFDLATEQSLNSEFGKLASDQNFLATLERFSDVGFDLESLQLLTGFCGGQIYNKLTKKWPENPNYLLYNVMGSNLKSNLGSIRIKSSKLDYYISGTIKNCILPSLNTDCLIPVCVNDSILFFRTKLAGQGVTNEKFSSVDLSVDFFQFVFKKFKLSKKSFVGKIKKDDFESYILENVLLFSAVELGVCSRALQLANDFAKKRSIQGFPISKHQSISHKLVDMLIEIEQLKSGLLYAAETFHALSKKQKRELSSMIKFKSSSVTVNTVQKAIQIFGAKGFQWSALVNFLLRRALFIRCVGGAIHEHLEVVAASIFSVKKSRQNRDHLELSILANNFSGERSVQREIFQ